MADCTKQHSRKALVIVVACLCIAACAAGGIWAYLADQTAPVANTFVPAKVTCAVEETFAGGVKSNVTVRNTGNVDAYIRATAVVTFVAEDGKVLATAPVEGVDYTVTWADSGWTKGSDGYWYHADPVAPNGLTANLIQTAAAVSAPAGYRLNIQIVATAIQSDPADAVQEAWGIAPTGGKLLPN